MFEEFTNGTIFWTKVRFFMTENAALRYQRRMPKDDENEWQKRMKKVRKDGDDDDSAILEFYDEYG